MGNIIKENFEDIWNNDKFRSLKKGHLLGNPPDV